MSDSVQEVHLLVLAHGLWGSPANLRHVCRSLIKKNPGAYLAPRSEASSSILTEREAQRIKKEQDKRTKAKAKAKGKDTPSKLPNAWEEPLLEPDYSECGGQPPKLQLVILNTRSNEDRTYDGIDWSAERVRLEIDAEVLRLRTATSPPCHIARFSILGYSLGGLVSRYTVGLLHSRHFFTLVSESHILPSIDDKTAEQLQKPPVPVQFITMATPHLGMLPPSSNFRRFAAYVGARLLSRTGEQLFLADSGWEGIADRNRSAESQSDSQRPPSRGLIEAMSIPEFPFMAALQRFEKVLIYANGVNDPTVPFRTAAIFPSEPFVVEGLHVEIEPDYPGLIQSYSFPTEAVQTTSSWTSSIRNYQVPMFLNPRRIPLRFPLNYIAVPLFPFAFPVLLTLVLTRFRQESGDSKKRIRELRRLWREEQVLESDLGKGKDGKANGNGSGDASDGAEVNKAAAELSLEDAGRRMSAAPGAIGSAATSGTATPNVSVKSTPTSSKPALSSSDKRTRENEEHLGEQSRISALLTRMENRTIDAAEMGDGTLEGNRQQGDQHGATVVTAAAAVSSSSSSGPSSSNDQYPVAIPSEMSKSQPSLFPLQKRMIDMIQTALGSKLERKVTYFPQVLNAHPVIIVRVPSSELSKLGEGIVRNLVDTFVL
ncbi:unnamed protein product [Tilletia controversa]|uniref:DUF676 domain-containing protein n=3 Tax=Tilletia TaxID=13289 RepID=A0A8X7SVA7_9BASI|nr:hypothetical protein CF336_g5954 [Tilletia laevis]KAE8192823.1 hypothetical protein CF328_g5237 [Tilletia controversa]KAE8256465.1 hypothetical protein A4X03_0g5379 [Tilletia caries]KAE8193988.1 hypothetical protein CF335_g5457 [Tilletia laevis]KAE8243858.1 hypothetical protein A4X06_0g6080 [Tilletia controversa]